jgi:hypothetical protein
MVSPTLFLQLPSAFHNKTKCHVTVDRPFSLHAGERNEEEGRGDGGEIIIKI